MTSPLEIQQDQYFEAQAGVLGALLLDAPNCAGEIFQKTRPEHYTEACRTVFEAAQALHREGKPIDPVTIKSVVGGEYTQFLLQLMEMTPTAANYQVYVTLLLERAQLSQLQAAGLALAACRTAEEAQEAVDKANRALVQKPSARLVGSQAGYLDFLARLEQKPSYIPWGLEKLDKAVLSERGDFVVIGGRPSAGKTALSLQFAWAQAKDWNVGYFSLETSPEKIYDRLAAMVSGVAFGRVKERTLRQEDYDRLADAQAAFRSHHLEVIHAVGMTVGEIRAITANRSYDIVYIDYLQFLQGEGRKSDDLYRRVTQISMDLHAMAGTMGVLVVALSQLSRPPKERQSKAPALSSLRESGQIEQDADAVLLLYKTDEENPASSRRLQIAKNKEGRTGGYLDLSFDGAAQRFQITEEQKTVQQVLVDAGKAAKQKYRAHSQIQFQELFGQDQTLPF